MSFLTDSNRIAEELRLKASKRGPARERVFDAPFKMIDRRAVEAATCMSRSKLYALINPESPYFDPTFPQPLRIGARQVRWREDELIVWMNNLQRAVR